MPSNDDSAAIHEELSNTRISPLIEELADARINLDEVALGYSDALEPPAGVDHDDFVDEKNAAQSKLNAAARRFVDAETNYLRARDDELGR